jgi:hypothetical protein
LGGTAIKAEPTSDPSPKAVLKIWLDRKLRDSFTIFVKWNPLRRETARRKTPLEVSPKKMTGCIDIFLGRKTFQY